MSNSYATDGRCHNANRGTYGHECGKPATWIGTNKRTGFRSGYCDHCKRYGDEAQACDKAAWVRIHSRADIEVVGSEALVARTEAGNRFLARAFEHVEGDLSPSQMAAIADAAHRAGLVVLARQ